MQKKISFYYLHLYQNFIKPMTSMFFAKCKYIDQIDNEVQQLRALLEDQSVRTRFMVDQTPRRNSPARFTRTT